MATLLARGQITIAAIKDGKDGKPGADGKNYWQEDVWVDLSAATYDQNTWYTVVGEQLPQTGFAGIKVVVNLNSNTKPSWSTHSAGFSVDFHIDTQASGWGTTYAETIIYSDTFNFCSVSPVSYKQLGWGSRPILYLRGGGKYRVFSTYNASWKIYKDGYTWQSGQYSQSAKPSSTRPTPEGHTLKGDKGDTGNAGFSLANGKSMYKDLLFDEGYNGCEVYNNLNNGNVKLSIVSKSSDNPYSIAKKELKIETTGAASPGHGGVEQTIMSRASAVFVRRVIAKIPKGYYLDSAENAMGTGMVKKWLTPQVGTGVFTEYIYMYQCGASGNFSNGGHMYLSDYETDTIDKPVVWYIASCETYDMTAGSSAQIKSTEVMYATSTSGTSAPTSGWQKNIPTVASGSFLWSRFTVTYMDGSNAVSYNVSKMGDRGPQGPTGAAGKDAVSASFSPAALTFSAKTESNGNATANTTSGNTATITMLEGSSVVTGSYVISSAVGCSASVAADGTVTVKSVAYDTIDGRAISRTSASVTVKCVYNGKTCYVSLPISVSVSAVWGGLVTSQKGLESKYTEVSNKYNALPLKTPEALTQYTSTIKQTAREISLKVSQTAVGRKNLLVGSAFCKQSDKWKGNDSYIPYISVLNQYNGHNSVVLENGANTYHGLDFIRVPVKTGKYTAGVMAKFNGKPENGSFAIYVARKDADGKPIGNNSWIAVEVSNVVVGQWSLYSTSFDIEDKCKMIDLCFVYTNNPTAWFAQPMLVEGDEYVGWSLSEEDAEYIGGNLLDNTDTLVQGGNLEITNGNLYTDANSYKGFPTRQVNLLESTGAFLGILQWDLSNDGVLTVGQDYMLSFWAKGNIGGKFMSFLYKDGNQVVYTEVLDRAYGPNQHQAADGNAGVIFKEDYVWRQYWVHWRVVGSNLPKYVQIRCMKGCDLYISQPKLEYGATVTEYRATKTDFVEDKSVAGKLLDAGIDVDSKEITLTADKTKFRTRSGQKVAVFDENGLNADLINAKHVWAKSEDGNSTVGHFGNYEPDFCKVSDNVYAPLFVGSSTAANAPFYVTSTGEIKATAGYIGDFTIKGGSLVNEYDKKSMRLGGSNIIFENTSDGKFDLKMGSSVLSEVVGVNTQGGLYLNMKRNYPTSTTSGSETQVNMGLLLNVSGTMDKASREHPWIVNSDIPNGNHAIFIGQGDIAGFRPMLTKAKTSRALSKMECVIVCCPPQNANIILTLPDDPEIGQHYTFIQRNGRYTGVSWGKVILKSTTSGKPISAYGAANTREIGLDWQFQITEVWFDGDFWLLQWHAQI